MRLVAVFAALVLGACSNNPEAAPTVFPPQPSTPVNVTGTWLVSWGAMSGSGHFCGASDTLSLTQSGSTISGTYYGHVVSCDAWTGDSINGTVTGTVSGYNVVWDLGSSNLHQVGVFLNGNPTVPAWASGTYAIGDQVYDSNNNIEQVKSPPARTSKTAYAVGDVVLDSNGKFEQCTVAGTSAAAAPTWNVTVGGTTTDSTVTWTNLGDKAPTGVSAPTWNATVGGTTTDGAIIWKNLGSRFQLTGTSVWTNTNYLAMGILAPCGNTAANADPAGCADSLKAAVAKWTPGTYAVGQRVFDPNDNVEQCTVAGTTGPKPGPTWNTTVGGTTIDGINPTAAAWAAGTYAVGDEVYDSNNNIEQATVAGTTGATAPTWNTTVGGTTADGTVTWKNLGSRFAVTWKNLGSRFLMADTATIAKLGSNWVGTSH